MASSSAEALCSTCEYSPSCLNVEVMTIAGAGAQWPGYLVELFVSTVLHDIKFKFFPNCHFQFLRTEKKRGVEDYGPPNLSVLEH